MGISKRFGRISTELEQIPDDEPVFLIRASDRGSIAGLDAYLALCSSMGDDQERLDNIQQAREFFRVWQSESKDAERRDDQHR